MDDLIHRVCEFLSEEAEIASGCKHSCKRCPVNAGRTPYQCIVRAQALIALVKSGDSASGDEHG